MGANFESMANFRAFRSILLRISFRVDILSWFLADEALFVCNHIPFGSWRPRHIPYKFPPCFFRNIKKQKQSRKSSSPKKNEILPKNNIKPFYTPPSLDSSGSEFSASSATPLILPTSVQDKKSKRACEHFSSAKTRDIRKLIFGFFNTFSTPSYPSSPSCLLTHHLFCSRFHLLHHLKRWSLI